MISEIVTGTRNWGRPNEGQKMDGLWQKRLLSAAYKNGSITAFIIDRCYNDH